MGFCACTVKFVLFLFNLVCALLGLLILGISTYALMKGKSFKDLLSGEITITSIVLIVIGGAVFLIAFFGCCGAIREDTCMLTTYGVILSAILLIQVAIGVMAFVYKGKFEHEFKKVIAEKFDHPDDPQNMDIINDIQKNVVCCGLHGPNSWTKYDLPASCCNQSNQKESCTSGSADLHHDGCEPKIISLIKSSFQLLGAIALGIAGVELICVIFAFCLSSSIRREEMRAYA